MNTIKISARSVEEARTQAMLKLGISSDRLEYNVISEPKKGFLGIGAKQAVIEAWAKEDKVTKELDDFMNTSAKEQVLKLDEQAEEKKADKTPAKPAKKKEPREANNQERKPSNKPEKKQEKKNKPKTADNTVTDQTDKKAAETAGKTEVKAEVKKKSYADNKKPEDSKAEEKKPEKSVTVDKKVEKPVDKVEKSVDIVENTVDSTPEVPAEPKVKLKLEDVKDTPEEFITKVCNAMGIDVHLETTFDDKDNILDINMLGDDMGILIGKRGQTLDSLQYLTGLVVNKEQSEYIRVKLDTENYRERRKDTLENLAKNIAHKVTKTRKPVALEPMNPYERRVIHAALQNDKFVCTRSEGEEPFRHVVVSLKKDVNLAPRNKGGRNFKGSYNRNSRSGYNRRRDANRDRKPASNTSSEGQKTE